MTADSVLSIQGRRVSGTSVRTENGEVYRTLIIYINGVLKMTHTRPILKAMPYIITYIYIYYSLYKGGLWVILSTVFEDFYFMNIEGVVIRVIILLLS